MERKHTIIFLTLPLSNKNADFHLMAHLHVLNKTKLPQSYINNVSELLRVLFSD